eukprot:3873609-Prorocentrum_lima.AAC.1
MNTRKQRRKGDTTFKHIQKQTRGRKWQERNGNTGKTGTGRNQGAEKGNGKVERIRKERKNMEGEERTVT